MADEPIGIDAKTFQEPLILLAQTMVEKVTRQAVKDCGWPEYTSVDVATMLRYSISIYRLLLYLNADVRRKEDHLWRTDFGVSAMSLVRSLIDCFYNISVIVKNPADIGAAYRKSGFKKLLADLAEEQAASPDKKRVAWIDVYRQKVFNDIRRCGFTAQEVEKEKPWPTLGKYVSDKKVGGVTTPEQDFLKTFTHLEWRQYSALSHGAYEAFAGNFGAAPLGAYFLTDFLSHENRAITEESYAGFLSVHIGRASAVLLAVITEIQAHCRFDGARINERICEIWATLLPHGFVRELHDGRYRDLMKEHGITAIGIVQHSG